MRKKNLTYPDAIVYPIDKGRHRFYKLKEPAIKLLSEVSLSPEESVRNIRIRRSWWVLPGFAITTGKDIDNIVIYMSNIYFNNTRLGNNSYIWLRQLSHECVHIQHRAAFKSQWRYIISFAWDYVKHFSHDTPREREADEAIYRFDLINKHDNRWSGCFI